MRSRLFVAVWPTAEVVETLAALPRVGQHEVRWVPAENWHVTLRFFGEAEEDELAERLAGGAFPVALATYGPRVTRLGDGVVVPVAGLADLAASVVAATADLGVPPGRRPFHGHLTLARLRRRDRSGLLGHAIDATMPVEEVTLVRSTLHPTGARYEVIRRWPARLSGRSTG